MNPLLANKIIDARKALTHIEIVDKDGIYKSVFKGYIASLGTSIVSNGLLPAFLLYEKDEKDDAAKVSKVMAYLVPKENERTALFSTYLLKEPNRHNSYKVLKDVAEYVIALKLALSTYQKND